MTKWQEKRRGPQPALAFGTPHRFIGFRPGDPTVGELPAQVPPPATQPADDSTPQVVRLRDWSMQQLLAEAAITLAADPFADLLPQPPGRFAAPRGSHAMAPIATCCFGAKKSVAAIERREPLS